MTALRKALPHLAHSAIGRSSAFGALRAVGRGTLAGGQPPDPGDINEQGPRLRTPLRFWIAWAVV